MDEVVEQIIRENVEREEREAIPGQVSCPLPHAANGTVRDVPEYRDGCPACGAVR